MLDIRDNPFLVGAALNVCLCLIILPTFAVIALYYPAVFHFISPMALFLLTYCVPSSIIFALCVLEAFRATFTSRATDDFQETADKSDDKEDLPKDSKQEETKARFKKVEQIWNDKTYEWEERKKADSSSKEAEDSSILFKALHRTYQFDDKDGYTLIEMLSPHLIKTLRAMEDIKDSEELWSEEPSVFSRDVFLFAPEIRQEVQKRKQALVDQKTAKSDEIETQVKIKIDETIIDDDEKQMSSQDTEESIDHLQVLLDFIAKDFSSTKLKLDHLNAQSKISFRLLWTLFKPGTVAVSIHTTTEDKVGLKVTRAVYTKREETDVFLISGQTIEWNGEKMFRNRVQRIIPFFTGLRKYNQLQVYPVTAKLKEELTERGRRYLTYIGEAKYVSYTGALTQRVGRDIIKTRAEGRCVADMANYRRLNPGNDLWSGDDEFGDADDLNELPKEENVDPTQVTEEDLCLTPPTIFGFSMVLKEVNRTQWGELRYEEFAPIQFDEDAWNHLELDPHYKKLIKALVEASCAEEKSSKVLKDVIAGKGSGLIACLHGSPGTGKTLTSESIAEYLKRPLYSISAGELGTEPRVLERTLRDTLELARTWKAVLLIDEADVILEARSQHEIQRNGLVSIFLRLLEYHQGILLLTTNRIKTFDEAFLSRFSIAIRYPNLDQATRKVVWTKFLRMAGVGVGGKSEKVVENGDGLHGATIYTSQISKDKLKEFSSKSINGREIKQVIRTSQAIALSENSPLLAEHIESVLKMQDQFTADFKTFDLEGMYKNKEEKEEGAYLYH